MKTNPSDKKMYLIYILLLISFIYLGNFVVESMIRYMDPFALLVKKDMMFSLFSIPLGIVLGSEHILNEKAKEGKWILNIKRLLIMGIPILILAYGITLYYTEVNFIQVANNVLFRPFLKSEFLVAYMAMFKLIFGYIIITSFYKYSSEE